jgi:hypothetical protein
MIATRIGTGLSAAMFVVALLFGAFSAVSFSAPAFGLEADGQAPSLVNVVPVDVSLLSASAVFVKVEAIGRMPQRVPLRLVLRSSTPQAVYSGSFLVNAAELVAKAALPARRGNTLAVDRTGPAVRGPPLYKL